MESPVRLCLGAALVVNLLLLSGTCVYGNTLPNDTTATTIKDEKTTRLARVNDTSWIVRNRLRSPDVALNELNPKEITSEEHTEKNAKYKDRGRVRFGSQRKSAIQSRTSRVVPTEATKLIIVTPTPEVKKPTQIINSMRSYKKNKIAAKSSTAAPISVEIGSNSEEESEENDSFEKYTSTKFHDSEFYTMPNSKENYGFDSTTKGSHNKKQDLSTPIGDISSFYSRNPYRSKDDPFKTDNFFDFTSDLTTPRNDFFDKKFKAISKSIINNLASIEKRTARSNSTNLRRVVKENIDLNKTSNNTPTNKSTVIFKNTKEVRLLDNDKAGTTNKELSDVQGTSIYYEMSVLSTETYAVNHSSDDDCDDEATSAKPTTSTSPEAKDVSRNTTQSTPATAEPSNKNESLSAASSNYFNSSKTPDNINEESNQLSTGFPPVFSSISPFPVSAQNLYSTEKTTRLQSNAYANRQRNYSKRLNFSAVKDSPNSVTSRTENYTNQGYKQATRKFLHTTPKSKPVWMAPRVNITRNFVRTTHPTTIYSEHFSIRDRNFSTPRPRQSNKTMLTTVSSEIDPVLQSDVAGVKKIVQSQSIADNSIPALWKRGSTTYSSSTTAVPQIQSSVNDLEIPPTLTAWALASLRSPPSRPAVNVTRTTQKNVDENELQKVGDLLDKKDASSAPIIPTTPMNDYVSKKVIDIEQNRLPWRPVQTPPTSSNSQPVSETTADSTATKSKSERIPAESNVSLTADATSTVVAQTDNNLASEVTTTSISAESFAPTTTISNISNDESTNDTIPPVDATKSTGFESITKFPAGVTTPKNDMGANPTQNKSSTTPSDKKPSKDDYEITTIRFSYVPTIDMTEKTLEDSTTLRQAPPTRTKTTPAEGIPITTYRPSYSFTTDTDEETTITEIERSTSQESSPETELTSTEELTSASNDIETTSSQSAEDRATTIEAKTDASTEAESSETTSFSTEIRTDPSSETSPSEIREPSVSSEANSGSNEVITQQTTKMTDPTIATTSETATSPIPVDTTKVDIVQPTTEAKTTETSSTEENEKIVETTSVEDSKETTAESSTDSSTISEETDGQSNEVDDVTTEASSRVVTEEAGSGAAIAIAVSTIGVIALILLVGLLLVVRRRSRRGVYAQRCTPVSLDAYSLDSVSVGHRKGNHRFRTSKRSYGNPAYDDEVTSHPMQYAALANFALDVESITAEFAEIPTVTVRPDEVPAGCEDKNRYSNVLPLPETRVPLKRIGNDPTTEYINANYVTGPGNIRNYYILCQAPLANTVVDFWRMIWEQNSRLVVMLTEYMENGVEKCYEYLPPSEVSDNKRTFGDFQIILKKREQKDKYAISSVQLINMATQTWREVTHLWYFWPAKGVPEDYDSVIDFLGEMRNYMKISQNAKEYDEEGVEVIYSERSSKLWALRTENTSGAGGGPHVYSPARAEDALRRGNGTLARMKAASEIDGVRPCVVTCASGAGRAGVVAAADVCARAAPDVPRAVRALRAQRPHALHNRQHYIFLYKLLSEYGKKMMGAGVDTI